MAIVPQRRASKTRKRLRRTHYKLDLAGMMVCPNCGEMKLAHVVCKFCGHYDGKQVKEIKVKEGQEPKEAETKTEKKSKKETKKETKKPNPQKKKRKSNFFI